MMHFTAQSVEVGFLQIPFLKRLTTQITTNSSFERLIQKAHRSTQDQTPRYKLFYHQVIRLVVSELPCHLPNLSTKRITYLISLPSTPSLSILNSFLLGYYLSMLVLLSIFPFTSLSSTQPPSWNNNLIKSYLQCKNLNCLRWNSRLTMVTT